MVFYREDWDQIFHASTVRRGLIAESLSGSFRRHGHRAVDLRADESIVSYGSESAWATHTNQHKTPRPPFP